MAFKEILKERLARKLDDNLFEKLPSGFQSVGDIAVINLKPELLKHKREIGRAILEIFPRFRTVCNKVGGISGEFREPQIEVIAGSEGTETVHLENNCKYKLDIKKLMFAKGNINERARIAKQAKPGEVIVDMFAGIGYFTIPLGKLSGAKKIYAIELNPNAFHYLQENIKINHIANVEAINGDSRKEVLKLVEAGIKADRVVMGYLPPPKDFLPTAMKVVKRKGVIHYEALINTDEKEEDIEKNMKDIEEAAKIEGLKIKLIKAVRVKGYSPRTDHYVLDIQVS
jgi:tRNA wybutosine-synthesizing protein 2